MIPNPDPEAVEPFIPHMISGFGANGLMWGTKAPLHNKGIVFAPHELPELPFIPNKVIRHDLPNGQTAFFAMASESNGLSKIYLNGQWRDSPTYEFATGMTPDGTAIRPHQGNVIPAPLLINGKWTELHRAAPDVPSKWWDETLKLTDITPSGWVLGQRGSYYNNDEQSAVMLPIQIHGTPNDPIFDGATGVDDFSIGSSNPDLRGAGHTGAPSVQYKLWVMAPAGAGTTRVSLNAPLNSSTPLKLSAPGLKFSGTDFAILNGTVNHLDITATTPQQSGLEVDLDLKLGDASSQSRPIGIKIMKRRAMQVKLHKVIREKSGQPDNPPDIIPNAAALQTYLNNIYGPQINANFLVLYGSDIELDWDMDEDDVLDGRAFISANSNNEQGKILAASPNDEESNIRIFLISGGIRLNGDSWGIANRASRTYWIMADPSNNPDIIMPPQPQTIAHEIGHILIGAGHPNEKDGPAPLPNTRHSDRLMVGGSALNPEIPISGNRLVKAEWDESEKWMQQEENVRPMNP